MDMLQLIGAMSRATADKVAVEQKRLPIVTATALSIDRTIDAYPHVRCHIDGNPAGQVDIVPIATGADWPPGQRITIEYTHPAGAWAHGPTLGSNVAYYCAVAEGTDSPTACVTFTLDKEQTVGIDFAISPGSIDHWTVDGATVSSPSGEFIHTMTRLEPGEHTICVIASVSKDVELVTLKVETGGANISDEGCLELGTPLLFDDIFLLNASDSFSPASGGSGAVDAFTTSTANTVNFTAVLQSLPAPGGFTLAVGANYYDEFFTLIQGGTTSGDASNSVAVNLTLPSPQPAGHYILVVQATLTPNFWQAPVTPPDPARTVHWTGSVNP